MKTEFLFGVLLHLWKIQCFLNNFCEYILWEEYIRFLDNIQLIEFWEC